MSTTAAVPAEDRVFGYFRKEHVQRYSTLVVLIAMFLVFTVTVDRFLTSQNLLNIAQQISMLTIVGCGLTFGFAAREMDLSVGYTVGCSGILVPLLLVAGTPLPLALLAGLAAGVVIGAINAGLVTLVGIPSLIATLATGSVLFGINFLMTGGRAIYGGLPPAYLWLGQGRVAGIPVLAFFMIAAVLVAWFVMERTVFGRYIYAVGGNSDAAHLSGVRVHRIRTVAFVISGLTASVAGVLVASRVATGQADAGLGLEISAIAAIVIGGTSINGGEGAVWRTVFGVLLVTLVGNGFNLLNLNPIWQQVFMGAVILAAVAIDSWSKKSEGTLR
jgi:ribose transport system permease protein